MKLLERINNGRIAVERGLLAGLVNGTRALQGKGPNFSVTDFDRFLDWVRGETSDSWSGENVSRDGALALPVVWACINVISSSLARFPIHVLRKDREGRVTGKDPNHYLWDLLQVKANPLMTSYWFRQLMQVWLLQHGNAIAYVNFNGRGQATELWPWHPQNVEIEPRTEGPWYGYRLNGEVVTWKPYYEILHIRGLGTDGFWGLSPLDQHRQTVGLGLAMKKHGAKFFKNGARPLGLLKFPGILGEEKVKRLRSEWKLAHSGDNALNVAILESGLEYEDIGLSMVDAQYIEGQQMTIEDICRVYNVPPHKVQHLLRMTDNNIEHQGLEWLQDTIDPYATNWEQQLALTLLSARERREITLQFQLDATMRADAKSRGDYLAKVLQYQVMKKSEARDLLGLPYDEASEEYYVQQVGPPQQPGGASGADNGDSDDSSELQ